MNVNYIQLLLSIIMQLKLACILTVCLLHKTERDALKNITKPAPAKRGMSESCVTAAVLYKYAYMLIDV